MNKMSTQEIATTIYANGGRARDCGVKNELKQYGELIASEILEKLAEIEINKHLGA
jgi:hypothetical protein